MANINLTIKTLDSQNHQFSVSQELTVKELKEHIAEDVGTPSETQRLIYCGRVLQDEKKLVEYDLNGKVVHLVQRAPPSATPSNNNNNPPTGNPRPVRSSAIHYHLDRGFQNGAAHSFEIGAAPASAGSSSLLRLNTARRMLQGASNSLGRISTVPPPGTQLFTMDNTAEGNYSGGGGGMQFAQAATAAALAAAFSTVQSMGGNNIAFLQSGSGPSVQGSFGFRMQHPHPNEGGQETSTGSQPVASAPAATNSATPSAPAPAPTPASNQTQQQQPTGAQQNQRNPRITVFADVIEDVERIQQDLRPHLTTVRQLLRDDPALDTNSADYCRAQHTYNQVAEGLHYLAHAFHAMSDLMVDFGAAAPREVRARPYIYQQVAVSSSIPIHASISVETTHSRVPQQQHQQQSNSQPPSATTTTATSQESNRTPSTASPTSTPAPPLTLPHIGGRARGRAMNFEDVDRTPGLSNNVQVPPSSTPSQPSQPSTQARSSLYSNPFASFRQSFGRASSYGVGANQETPRQPQTRPRVESIRLPNGGAFARLPIGQGWQPVALGGHHMAPMVFMEVRSGNQAEDHTPSPTIHSPSGNQSEFDDFLPCHSRHVLRPSRGESAAGSSRSIPTIAVPVAANLHFARPNPPPATGTNVPAGGDPRSAGETGPPRPQFLQGFDLLSQIMQQLPVNGTANANGGTADEATGTGPSHAIFNNLVEGVMSEMTGVARGQQSSTTVAAFLRGITELNHVTGESIFYDLFMMIAERLTFRDLMLLFFGNPDVLNQIREPLSPFVRQRVLNGGEFEEASIRHGSMELVQQIIPMLREAMDVAQVRSNVDFVSTMASCIQQRLHDIIQLVGIPGDNPNFGQLMMDQIRQSLTMISALALSCFSDGQTSLERVFSVHLRGVSDGVHPAIQEWTTRSSIERLRAHMATIDLNQIAPVIEPLVMNTDRGRSWLALFNAELEEQRSSHTSSTPSSAESEPSVALAAPLAQQEELEEPMVVDQESAATVESSSVPHVAVVPRRARLERLRQEVAARGNVHEPEPNIDVVLGSQTWHSDVPQEWVPVIARDIQRQNRAPPQGPLSDAYLAGIPNKRRKLAQGNRPNVNPQLLVRETMERALRTANVASPVVESVAAAAASHAEVGPALLPELRRLGSARLDAEGADFDPERFPNAERFFHDTGK